jgi:hypothetical protein
LEFSGKAHAAPTVKQSPTAEGYLGRKKQKKQTLLPFSEKESKNTLASDTADYSYNQNRMKIAKKSQLIFTKNYFGAKV